MSILPAHFTSYRTTTANSPAMGNRKTCTGCKQPKSQLGGVRRRRPGSCRFDWYCAGCATEAA